MFIEHKINTSRKDISYKECIYATYKTITIMIYQNFKISLSSNRQEWKKYMIVMSQKLIDLSLSNLIMMDKHC